MFLVCVDVVIFYSVILRRPIRPGSTFNTIQYMAALTAKIHVNGEKKEFIHHLGSQTDNKSLIKECQQLQTELNDHLTHIVEQEKASNGASE